MRMPVPKPLMPVPMRMRLGHRSVMAVLMMFVVDVPVFVLDRLVRMVMAVSFGQMKPEAERHKHAGADQLSRHRLAEQDDRDDRAKERREREISSRSGAAEMTQRQHKQHQTDPDPDEPDEERRTRRADRRQAGAEKQRQIRFALPAARPLISAMTTGSADESFRVRLLSMPHARHAAAISKPPPSIRIPCPCQESTTAPARIEAAPSRSLRSTFSRKTTHAMAMVASPSRFNNSEPDAAEVRASPSIRNSGPMTPPNMTIAISHGISARRSGASEARMPSTDRPAWPIANPMPAPR